MRATLDWSYDLLSGEEQNLFRRLSVFAGGFTLEAAGAICAAEPGGGDVLDPLGRLVEQSLVAVDASFEGEEMRYKMLEPVRQYALERLKGGGDEELVRGRPPITTRRSRSARPRSLRAPGRWRGWSGSNANTTT